MDIRIRQPNGVWIPASESQVREFQTGKLTRLGNAMYGPTYLGTTAIADWNDVKLFLIREPVAWYPATPYQTWAYFDFLYNNKDHITYPSEDGSENGAFSIGRNDNGSIYIETDARIRISDNEHARRGYLGFYHRIIDGL